MGGETDHLEWQNVVGTACVIHYILPLEIKATRTTAVEPALCDPPRGWVDLLRLQWYPQTGRLWCLHPPKTSFLDEFLVSTPPRSQMKRCMDLPAELSHLWYPLWARVERWSPNFPPISSQRARFYIFLSKRRVRRSGGFLNRHDPPVFLSSCTP